MKYSDKVWKYFNFDDVSIFFDASNGIIFNRRLVHNISGEESYTYSNNISSMICLVIVPFAYNIVKAYLNESSSLEKNTRILLVILTTIVIPIIILFIKACSRKKNYQNHTPNVRNLDIYKRDLPSNLRPAHVYMLIHNGRIDRTSLAATILDLVDRGYLEIIREKNNVGNFFGNKKMTLRRTNKSNKNLFKYEKFLIKWFIDIYGDGKEVNNFQIKKALEECSSNVIPCEMFEHFQALVAISFPLQLFYDRKIGIYTEERKIDYGNLKVIIAILISLLPIPYITGIISVALAADGINKKAHYLINQNGVEEKDSWFDLQQYLNDFTLIDDKSIDAVAIYNFYLTYSIVLGINEKVEKEIGEFFGKHLHNALKRDGRYENDSRINWNTIQPGNLTEKDIKEIEQDINEELEKYRK